MMPLHTCSWYGFLPFKSLSLFPLNIVLIVMATILQKVLRIRAFSLNDSLHAMDSLNGGVYTLVPDSPTSNVAEVLLNLSDQNVLNFVITVFYLFYIDAFF